MSSSPPQAQVPEPSASITGRELRRAVSLPGFAALENGVTFPLTILDLSYDGCKIEAPIGMMPGLAIKISVVRLGVIDARVRWYSGGCAGLRFSPSAPIRESETPREHDRQTVIAHGSLRRSGQSAYRVRVFDLTARGCKIEFVQRPGIGETLWAKFDGLEALEAKVRWIEDHLTGIEFVRPMYPSVFQLLLARLGGPQV